MRHKPPLKGKEMGSEKRRKTNHVMVRVSPEEKAVLEEMAAQHDLSVPAYLRSLGLSHRPSSKVDAKAVEQLAKLHGDIGRIGGLLKLWLTDDIKGGVAKGLNVPDLVKTILSLQQDIGDAVRKL